MSRLAPPPAAVEYPSSDGKPLAENDAQLHAILYAVGTLREYYAEHPDVYVSGDLLIYYEEGNPRVSVAPDAFVVFGVEDRVRMNYKVWEEGKGPDFVLEVASRSTWREDVERKPAVYAGLGVREYFLFDPLGEYFAPRLQGYRLVEGAYERMAAVESIDRTLTLASEVLGLELRARPDDEMRFREPNATEDLRSHGEEAAARRTAEARARRESAARRAAEARADLEVTARNTAEARAEQEAAARSAAEDRADQEAAARNAAEDRADQEAAARQAAEARIAELEARIREGR